MADFYETLGVSRDADKEELKQAYRRLARKYHPDVNKEAGAEERFKEINRAYEVLSEPETRARYDRFGEAGVSGKNSSARHRLAVSLISSVEPYIHVCRPLCHPARRLGQP